MTAEERVRLLEGRIENLRNELAAGMRRADALESALLFFISLSDRVAEGPAGATIDLLEDLSRALKRKQDRQNAAEIDRLALLLAQGLGRASP